jgi:hypothetical protein
LHLQFLESILSDSHSSPARVIRSQPAGNLAEAETRMFQASSAFVSACQEATVAMHALTAKIKDMDKHMASEIRRKSIKPSA